MTKVDEARYAGEIVALSEAYWNRLARPGATSIAGVEAFVGSRYVDDDVAWMDVLLVCTHRVARRAPRQFRDLAGNASLDLLIPPTSLEGTVLWEVDEPYGVSRAWTERERYEVRGVLAQAPEIKALLVETLREKMNVPNTLRDRWRSYAEDKDAVQGALIPAVTLLIRAVALAR